MCSTKLPLSVYSTDKSAAVGAWVLLESKDAEQARGTVGRGGLRGSKAGAERPAFSIRGRSARPNVRNLDRVD